jgi:hypothetical protein
VLQIAIFEIVSDAENTSFNVFGSRHSRNLSSNLLWELVVNMGKVGLEHLWKERNPLPHSKPGESKSEMVLTINGNNQYVLEKMLQRQCLLPARMMGKTDSKTDRCCRRPCQKSIPDHKVQFDNFSINNLLLKL